MQMFPKLILVIANLFFSEDPHFVHEANKMNQKFLDSIKKEEQINVIAFGGGSYPEICGAHLVLEKKSQLTKNEARELIIHLFDQYVNLFNSKKSLRPYLNHYPFTGSKLSLYLYLGNDSYPKLGRVSLDGGIITYKTMLNENWCDPENAIEESETVEEAKNMMNVRPKVGFEP